MNATARACTPSFYLPYTDPSLEPIERVFAALEHLENERRLPTTYAISILAKLSMSVVCSLLCELEESERITKHRIEHKSVWLTVQCPSRIARESFVPPHLAFLASCDVDFRFGYTVGEWAVRELLLEHEGMGALTLEQITTETKLSVLDAHDAISSLAADGLVQAVISADGTIRYHLN